MPNTINVENSINSGQVFLWKKDGNYWYGVNGQNILYTDKRGVVDSYGSDVDFFRKKDNMKNVISSITKDQIVKDAVERYPGLRILRQDPFQCMISFIISSNSNIPKIRSSLQKITEKFGLKTKYKKKEFFLFPKPANLANASIGEIKDCGVGYRAKFIKKAATMIQNKEINFADLKKSKYQEAKDSICMIPGVGSKVADCIMLFSLEKLEAFPLDVWMIKVLEKYYKDEFELETRTVTKKQYEILHEKIVNYFGPYAGYAQQFLFKMERENYQKKW